MTRTVVDDLAETVTAAEPSPMRSSADSARGFLPRPSGPTAPTVVVEGASGRCRQQGGDVRRTEVDGLRVTWRLIQHHLIAIMAVNRACDASPVVSFGPDHFPDLVQARELFPELAKLWDAVRHEFWTKFIPQQRQPGLRRRWA
jgi:hypothetical protein